LSTVAIVAIVAGVLFGILTVAFSGSDDKKFEPKYSDRNFLEAMQRMHPLADKICLDTSNKSAFLIHYPDGIDEHWVDWFWVSGIQFQDFGNGRVSAIQRTDIDRYKKVFPDVAGLKCVEK
jgi:hypothetical protein